MFSPYRASIVVTCDDTDSFQLLDSLKDQGVTTSELELVLVDGGNSEAFSRFCSTLDGSAYPHQVLTTDNHDLAAQRNMAMAHVHGTYLFFLDCSDSLHKGTIAAVTSFFDSVYESTDLVAFHHSFHQSGRQTHLYSDTAVTGMDSFDFKASANAFFNTTGVAVCVKNRYADNTPFVSVDGRGLRELQFFIAAGQHLGTIGFCAEGELHSTQHANETILSPYALECYQDLVKFWEGVFDKQEGAVPRWTQRLFISDIAWRFSNTMLVPYHYPEPLLVGAQRRISYLLKRIDIDTIKNSPALDSFQKAYWIARKPNVQITRKTGSDGQSLLANGNTFFNRKKIEIVLLRTKPEGNRFSLKALLRSPSFSFGNKPRLFVESEIDGKKQPREELSLIPSSWSYHKAKTETNAFFDFEYSIQAKEKCSFYFEVELDGSTLQTNYAFEPAAIISSSSPKRYSYVRGGFRYWFNDNVMGLTKISDKAQKKALNTIGNACGSPEVAATRNAAIEAQSKAKRIWLYHDCHGVEKDNAYYQFIHDWKKKDGVARYYIVNDSLESKRHLFNWRQMRHVIPFASEKHKSLFLQAERIIIAYAELTSWIPFEPAKMKLYEDVFRADVIYLQNGVLHAHLPWKYAADRTRIDRVVVSTAFEKEQLTETYGYAPSSLIEAGMPRYDYINLDSKPKRKILYAPSWRQYLGVQKPNGQWDACEEAFLSSRFYRSLIEFLKSDELARTLEKHDYALDVKLHPIMNELYRADVSVDSPRISLVEGSVKDEDYAVLITDFSSYRFDFVYLKRAIMYFLPDADEFKSGMHEYRETDLPLDGMFGDLALSPQEAVEILDSLLKNDARPKPRHQEQMEDFFLYYDNGQCERIYSALCE